MGDELPQRIEWSAQEYHHYERSTDWYWGVGLVTLVIGIGAIFFGNILFAILILLGMFVLILYTFIQPHDAQFVLTSRGLEIDGELFRYQTLTSFWIDDIDPRVPAKLLLKTQRSMMPVLIIPLVDVDVELVHHFLLTKLPEVEDAEPLSHRLFELVGF